VTVNVAAPEVTVEAPTVDVHNDVQPAGVTVMPATPRSRKVQRDELGNIVGIVED